MRILHCCLAAFYIDDYGYQENILPKIHKQMGHDVKIIASTESYINNTHLGYVTPGQYETADGISLTRLAYRKWLPKRIATKVRAYAGLEAELEAFKPQLIFLHDCQFWDVRTIRAYASANATRVVADCHTDEINSARGFLSKHLLHGILYKWYAKTIEPCTDRFFGTLPLRCQFLEKRYHIDARKIKLLPFGHDDSDGIAVASEESRRLFRVEHGIPEDAIVFTSGGKIDRRKNLDALTSAFESLTLRQKGRRIFLVLFGEPDSEMQATIASIARKPNVRYLGWQHYTRVPVIFGASDIVIFPGTHSVLWETAVGLGVPVAAKRWSGIEHIDHSGNVVFLDTSSEAEVEEVLNRVVKDEDFRAALQRSARAPARSKFLYSTIARESLEL